MTYFVPGGLRRLFGCLLITGLVAGVVACEDNTFVAPPPPSVTVAKPVQQDVVIFTYFTGRTNAIESVNIRARVAGYLLDMLYTPGSMVKEGDVLYRIDPREYDAAIQLAKGELAANNATYEKAASRYKLTKEAYDRQAASQMELIQAKAMMDRAEAEIEVAKGKLQQAELNLSYTTVIAPSSGRIDRTLVDTGNLVGLGESTLLTTIRSQDPLYVYFDVSERDFLQYLERHPHERLQASKEPITVMLKLADGSKYAHPGAVDFAANTVNPQTGTITVRAVVPNPDFLIYPGMFVHVGLPAKRENTMLVPQVAIQRDMVGPYLLVVDGDNKVVRKDVQVGPQVATMQVISSGLDADDSVVISGVQRARPGVQVNPTMQTLAKVDMPDIPTLDHQGLLEDTKKSRHAKPQGTDTPSVPLDATEDTQAQQEAQHAQPQSPQIPVEAPAPTPDDVVLPPSNIEHPVDVDPANDPQAE